MPRTKGPTRVTQPDPVVMRIGEGIELCQAGRREAARSLLSEVWEQLDGEPGDAFHRCAVAHWMADVQDDVRDELLWDRRALEAADLVREHGAGVEGVAPPVAGLYASLHLNLAKC